MNFGDESIVRRVCKPARLFKERHITPRETLTTTVIIVIYRVSYGQRRTAVAQGQLNGFLHSEKKTTMILHTSSSPLRLSAPHT